MSKPSSPDQPVGAEPNDALEKALMNDLDLRQFIEEARQAAPVEDPQSIPKLTEVLPAMASNKPQRDQQMSEQDWQRMSFQLERNVLQRMLRRTDGFVDGPLADQLDEMLDRGAERLMADIKTTLQQAVRESVSRAIAEELSKIRADRRQ